MRPFRGRLMRPTTMLRTDGGGPRGSKAWAAVFVVAAAGVLLVAGFALAGTPASVEARKYSAYADREKPVISFLLSDPANVEDFQRKFYLTDAEMDDVLDAVRRENEILAGTYAKSEKIVSANRGLPRDRVKQKIAASPYDESVRAAVAQTKGEVKRILPPGSQPDLQRWVDARWREERESLDQESATFLTTSALKSGMTFRVFGTQYVGYTRREVAMRTVSSRRKAATRCAYVRQAHRPRYGSASRTWGRGIHTTTGTLSRSTA